MTWYAAKPEEPDGRFVYVPEASVNAPPEIAYALRRAQTLVYELKTANEQGDGAACQKIARELEQHMVLINKHNAERLFAEHMKSQQAHHRGAAGAMSFLHARGSYE
jgi:hypothetical protein